jgi:hypothetical protein
MQGFTLVWDSSQHFLLLPWENEVKVEFVKIFLSFTKSDIHWEAKSTLFYFSCLVSFRTEIREALDGPWYTKIKYIKDMS